MTEESTVYIILTFRICTAIAMVGLSLLGFILGPLLNEKSTLYFSLLHSLCTGIMLAMGFLCLPFVSIEGMNNNYKLCIVIISIIFILMISFSIIFTSSSYEYRPLNSNNDNEHDEDLEEFGLELLNHNDSKSSNSQSHVTIDGNDIENIMNDDYSNIDNDNNSDNSGDIVKVNMLRNYTHNDVINPISMNTKLFFNAVIISASCYDLFNGLYVGIIEHNTYSTFIQLIYYKILMSITFGTMLERLETTQHNIKLFMILFASSSPIGLFIGSFYSLFLTNNILLTNYNMQIVISIMSAISAGIYLNIAVMHMFPAEIHAVTGNNIVKTVGNCDGKYTKLCLLFFGFFITSLPCIVFSLYHF